MALRLHDPLSAQVPGEPRQPGATRTYGGYMRAIGTGLGIFALVAFLKELLRLVTEPLPPDHGPLGLLVAAMLLFAALPTGVLIMSQRLGIHVTDDGVENVAVDTKSFTPWEDIRGFVIAPASIPGNFAVNIVHQDGRTTPLSRLGDYPWFKRRTQSCCDALNQELAFMRAGR